MEQLFGFILLAAIIAMVVGLFSPSRVMPWSESPSRMKAFGFYLTASFGILILAGALIEQPDRETDEQVAEAPQEKEDKTEDAKKVAKTEDKKKTRSQDADSTAQSDNLEVSEKEKQQNENPDAPDFWFDLDKSDEMQAKRRELIEDLKAEGIFYKIENPTDYPRIYVDSRWHSLRYDDKENFINSALTYYFAENPEALRALIRDAHSGNRLGTYSFQYGMDLE